MNNNNALIKWLDGNIEKNNALDKMESNITRYWAGKADSLRQMKTYLLSLQSQPQDKEDEVPVIPIDEVLSILNENYQAAKKGKENVYTVKEYLGKDALDLLIETYEDLIAIFNKKRNKYSQSVEPLYKEDEKEDMNWKINDLAAEIFNKYPNDKNSYKIAVKAGYDLAIQSPNINKDK